MEVRSEGRRVLVLYGSQTGTAEDVATSVWREARRLHFQATLSAMDAYDRVIMLYLYVQLVAIKYIR